MEQLVFRATGYTLKRQTAKRVKPVRAATDCCAKPATSPEHNLQMTGGSFDSQVHFQRISAKKRQCSRNFVTRASFRNSVLAIDHGRQFLSDGTASRCCVIYLCVSHSPIGSAGCFYSAALTNTRMFKSLTGGCGRDAHT